jgi:hypothetical protein
MKTLPNQFVEKHDYSHILVLLLIALGLGIYAIAMTVLIAKDGVIYIERAQIFSSKPVYIIKGQPFGYPFLIFLTHKLMTFFGAHSSVLTWIHAAQSVTLICRLVALILLYLIGKFFVGGGRSFWAILILIILPYPAEFGVDVLRDWPNNLFLTAGFLFLLLGANKLKGWMFGAAGLISGLGFMVRPECAQLVIYGGLWLIKGFLFPKNNIGRIRYFCVLFILLVGFSIPAAPYVAIRGRILPAKLKNLISFSQVSQSGNVQISKDQSDRNAYKASALPVKLFQAVGRIIGGVSDNLMYYFMLPLVIGVYSHFGRKSEVSDLERFFIPAFVLLNIMMLVLLYAYWGYISRRHCLPLVVFLIFYVPEGLEIMGRWFEQKFSRSRIQMNQHLQPWFFILLAIGMVICMPKLLRPTGVDKRGYRDAARWLKDNTGTEDVVAVPDLRISFYAERKGRIYETKVPKGIGYVVRIENNGAEESDAERIGREVYSVAVDNREKNKKRILIYRKM